MLLRSIILASLLSLAAPLCAQTTQPSDWKPLFNGRDLTGWYTFLKGVGKDSDPQHVFQIHDGLIYFYKDAADRSEMPFGYICTKDELGDCRIRFQYKWGQKRFGTRATKRRDSGCLYFVFGDDGKQGGVWPYSVECQIQENDVGDVYAIGTIVGTSIDSATANAKAPTFKESAEGALAYTTPGKGNDRIVRSQMLEVDGWNTVEIVLQDDSATHIVNGKVNMRISHVTPREPDKSAQRAPLRKGRILFQAEGAEVLYRNIEMQPLAEYRADHDVLLRVEKLECPLVSGVGCGHLLAPLLARLEKIPGVRAAQTNWTGTMLHIAVTNLVKRQEIVDRAKQILQADASEVPDADAARAMISEDWRGPREVVELTSYEFHTHALRVLKNFAQREKLTDDVTARLARIVEDQWDASANASGSPNLDGDEYAKYWKSRCDSFIESAMNQAKYLLTSEQLTRLRQETCAR